MRKYTITITLKTDAPKRRLEEIAADMEAQLETLEDDVRFWVEAGYCLYPVSFGLLQFGGKA